MAIQRVYTYAFTVYLKSQQFPGKDGGGYHIGTNVQAIGATAAAAQAVLKQQFGTDLIRTVGGTQIAGPFPYTTLA